MAKALPEHRVPVGRAGRSRGHERRAPHGRRLDWRKAISDNIAYALLVYTALQIFVTMQAVKGDGHGSALPYLALVVLVGAVIPACRWLEARWEHLGDRAAADPALRPRFRRDQLMIWAMAIGLPFLIVAVIRLVGALLQG